MLYIKNVPIAVKSKGPHHFIKITSYYSSSSLEELLKINRISTIPGYIIVIKADIQRGVGSKVPAVTVIIMSLGDRKSVV